MSLGSGSTVKSGSNKTYYVEKELSKGGFGIVHLGRSSSGQRIVIKEPLLKGDSWDSTKIDKLKIEAEILKKVSHPNIVKYIDESYQNNNFYLMIEFVQGGSLFEKARKNPLPEDEVKRIIICLLGVLSYIHQMNIIHRDIKPQNILNPNDIKLIDFGAAKEGWTQLLPHGHTQIWTPGWSAPEQQSGFVSPRSDLYAVGATMFFLLTGEEPNNYMKGLNSFIKTPRELNNKISREIESITLKAMNALSTERYDNADDMITAIMGRSIQSVKEPRILIMGNKYTIKNNILIGREPPANVIIQGRYISRKHAEIYYDQGNYWVKDLGSKNGTWLYDKIRNDYTPINKPSKLKDNDIIALCYDLNQPKKGSYVTFEFLM